MSRVVSIFPCCCLVCFCLLPRAALHDSCPSYSCLCASLVYIVFGICLADDPFGRCGIIARQRFILICFGRSLHPSHEAGLLPSPRLAGCPLRMAECIEGSRLSAVIGLCRSLWRPLAAAAKGVETHLPASQSVSAGGVTRRSAPGQVCGLALLPRLTCPHLDGRPPYSSRPRQLSQRVRTVPQAEEKSHRDFYRISI